LLFEISNIPKEDWDRIRNIDLGDHELLRAEQSWHFFTDLSSEDAHFFARSAASQSRFIGEFVDAAMAQAKERRLLPE
jgi:hypothetical protein